ncbi:hypothetical protein HPB50_013717 [Hyalomma asiaticum]|uniref:Uncharacterized protein n=1 Tax=Hyalomma asiaticum TaxID=266040 RepID=A0ACB7TJI4_HYAAI|nr:hypothetical protein HPB50_013717 [Hyalomma asiaticum]
MAHINNEILIAAVQETPPLWLARHRQHKDKFVKAALWREVAAIVMPAMGIEEATELLQKRWKSLRDKFRRLFTVQKKAKKSGAGVEDIDLITWPYFDILAFLNDTVETRATSGNFTSEDRVNLERSQSNSTPEPPSPTPSCQQRHKSQTRSPGDGHSKRALELLGDIVQFHDIEDKIEHLSVAPVHIDDDSHDVCATSTGTTVEPPPVVDSPHVRATSTVEPPPVLATDHAPVRHTGWRKRKNDDDVITEHVKDLCESLKKTESYNEHEHFCPSLARYMLNVPENRQLELKLKPMQHVMEYSS